MQSLIDSVDQQLFDWIYGRSVVYNTCWEDPAVDRKALQIQPRDRMLVITSAGCNVLDYALTEPERIHAVDANPRQLALLELKLAGIRRLEFDDFYAAFGLGRHPRFGAVYRDVLREELGEFAHGWSDRNIRWFAQSGQGSGGSFYYRGLSGAVARGFRGYLQLRPALRSGIETLLEANDLAEQRDVYDRLVEPQLWTPDLTWMLSRQLTMSLLGVPHPQRKEVQRQHASGVAGFIREAIEYVFRALPLRTNYFWTLYLRGRYSRDCCPEYLKPENFTALKAGAAAAVRVHTTTVTGFLREGMETADERIPKFVLLNHMDWMSSARPEALREEWQAILERAAPQARIIFRSAHQRPAYLHSMRLDGRRLRDRLAFQDGLAWALQPMDRVHTYAGFHIADVPA